MVSTAASFIESIFHNRQQALACPLVVVGLQQLLGWSATEIPTGFNTCISANSCTSANCHKLTNCPHNYIFSKFPRWLFVQSCSARLLLLQTALRPRQMLVLNLMLSLHTLLLRSGADDFTPLLIYLVIRANTPHLASNLAYIERYRYHSKLTSETQYYYIQLVRQCTCKLAIASVSNKRRSSHARRTHWMSLLLFSSRFGLCMIPCGPYHSVHLAWPGSLCPVWGYVFSCYELQG